MTRGRKLGWIRCSRDDAPGDSPALYMDTKMQQARVLGTATATTKHPSMKGWKLLIVQPLGIASQPDGDPALVVDHLGAGKGDLVLISSDGKGARKLIGDDKSPVRWFVMGICD